MAQEYQEYDDSFNTRLRHGLALALWHAENQGMLPDDVQVRAEMYDQVKPDYLRKAALTITHLDRQRISLSLDEEYV